MAWRRLKSPSLTWHGFSSQVVRIYQKPRRGFADLSDFVQVCAVFVIAERFSPQLPDALPAPVNLCREGWVVNRSGSQCPHAHKKFCPRTDIVTSAGLWPRDGQWHRPPPVDGR